MTVLDTFFLLFKTDAGKAKEEVAALEKQIDSLKEKGKKRSEEESKQLKEAVSRRKELTKSLNDETKEADNLADSLSKATSALIGFSAVRAGMTQANSFNSDLKVQSDLLRQNVRDLAVYSQAAKAAGGSEQGYLGDVNRFVGDAQSRGINPGQYTDWLKTVRGKLKGFTGPNAGTAKRQFLDQLGYVSDPGTRRMLLDDKEWNSRIGQAEKDVRQNQGDFDTARQIAAKVSSIDAQITSFLTKVSSLLGVDTSAGVQGIGGKALEAAGGIAIGRSVLRRVLGRGAAAAGAGSVGGASLGAAATGGLLGLGLAAGWGSAYYHRDVSSAIDSYLHGDEDEARRQRSKGSSNADLSYWMGKGYSAEQAAAIVANMQRESGGDPNSRGDGGRAHGLFQWHPDRRANILKNTGIDVSTASYQKQLDAAAWEMQNGRPGFSDSRFRGIKSARDAAAYFSQRFEGPGDVFGESMKRGKLALSIMSSTGMNQSSTKSSSVNIERIEVNTQAHDAQGIAQSIGTHLSSALGNVAANFDDGVRA